MVSISLLSAERVFTQEPLLSWLLSVVLQTLSTYLLNQQSLQP